MRVVLSIVGLCFVLVGCEVSEVENTSDKVYLVGYRCGAIESSIEKCAQICDRMGGVKATCWDGYFDGLVELSLEKGESK